MGSFHECQFAYLLSPFYGILGISIYRTCKSRRSLASPLSLLLYGSAAAQSGLVFLYVQCVYAFNAERNRTTSRHDLSRF
ncbi:hypothetical protein C2E23DRAFT_844365, partial [Lenzites betulinus]